MKENYDGVFWVTYLVFLMGVQMLYTTGFSFSLYMYRVVQKKFMMWSRGKVFEKFGNVFWWSLSLYIFTSSQEVRAF